MDQLILGTALWGWTINKAQCFALLDQFYAAGGRNIDTATNYPINKNPSDFRAAERILAEWINAQGVSDLEIMIKIGSVNNMMTPEHNLSPSFLLICADEYRHLFGQNLRTLMVHWDNRDDAEAITESISTLLGFSVDGIQMGLSGIKYPAVYASVLASLAAPSGIPLQIKHNLVYSDYKRVEPIHPWVKHLAYGINGGGIKLNTTAYSQTASLTARGGQPARHQALTEALNQLIHEFELPTPEAIAPQRMNHLGMTYALLHPGIESVLLGVSKTEQLADSLHWFNALQQYNYTTLWQRLSMIAKG